MKGNSVFVITLSNKSSLGVVSTLTMQYVEKNKTVFSDEEILRRFRGVDNHKFYPAHFEMDSPGPKFAWQSDEEDAVYCTVDEIQLRAELQEGIPVASTSISRVATLLVSEVSETFEVTSQLALKKELGRLRNEVTAPDPIMVVAEIGDDGEIARVVHRDRDPHVVLFSVDKRLKQGRSNYPDRDGNPVSFSLIRTESDTGYVGWYNLISDLGECVNSDDYGFLGSYFGNLPEGDEFLVDVEGLVPASEYDRVESIFNSFDFDSIN
ncbi:hypothetical protein [Vibrio owensii]|uniref:hypothetical protein n=1 Tax=Vibrio owensii TaxID=696485 RepID=UPI0018F260C1|nr:hypothetical protein [Vibrio owensii]